MSEGKEDNVVGRCIGEATPSYIEFVSKKMPKVGEYVLIDFDNNKVLGLITTLVRGSTAIPRDIFDPTTVERIKAIEGDEFYIKGIVRILGDVETFEIPRTPPPPGTIIWRADDETLKKVFTMGDTGIRIGTLISHPKVPVEIDVNRMVSRHLAILAITGAGKSNTVAVIVDRLLELGGCVLIFDMHSEYSLAEFPHGDINIIPTKINPADLSFSEFKTLLNIPPKAFIQERYFRKAYDEVHNLRKKGNLTGSFLKALREILEGYSENEDFKADKKSIVAVLNKLDDLERKYEQILKDEAGRLINAISLGKANIIDLGSVDEDLADVIVSHVLRDLLSQRKIHKRSGKGFPYPVFAVIEEAHILAPADRDTLSKYWITRIAREGRKFGVGLCLVSQRPKIIDSNALSQANNMIILRLVEPGDQRHVQAASETLSEDLVQHLASLNVGEAILLGMMTRVPALVKIDKFEGSVIGRDINIVKAWKEKKVAEETELKELNKEVDDLYGKDW
mgnify:CR=1 FL=1